MNKDVKLSVYGKYEQATARIRKMRSQLQEAKALLEPLADCDPAVRQWLKQYAEVKP
jgi:hypothetical protein